MSADGEHAASLRCTTSIENAHGTGFRELLYRWHPWFAIQVFIHEVIEKSDGAVFRCTLSGSDSDRWLEVPAWMFDRAACTGQVAASAHPFVDIVALSALAGLLADVLKTQAASSNARLSGSPRISHDQNRGEAHARKASDASEPDGIRSMVPGAADGAVWKRPDQLRNRRAGMAGTAGRDAGHAHRPDGAPDLGACGQEPDRYNDGGRS